MPSDVGLVAMCTALFDCSEPRWSKVKCSRDVPHLACADVVSHNQEMSYPWLLALYCNINGILACLFNVYFLIVYEGEKSK